MKIVVCGPETSLAEAGITRDGNFVVVNNVESFFEHENADGFINFFDDALTYNYADLSPVLANSVLETLPEGADSLYRFNGWPGFLKRDLWEVSGKKDEKVTKLLMALNKNTSWVKDEPGFIAARVVCMIVNEAFYALEDKVSTREEIDTAMKLGTGYPFGPFEWSEMIGADRISKLLQLLSITDKRYTPSQLLAGSPIHP